MTDPERAALKSRLDAQVAALVAAARPDWAVTADHCFLRIAYDNAVGARWDSVVARPAWRHLPLDALAAAIDILAAIAVEGPETLARLNADSLAWRRAYGVHPAVTCVT